MKKRTLKNFLLPLILMFSSFIWIYTNTYAQEISWYTIVPELTEEESKEVDAAIEEIWSTPQEVMDNYREQAEKRKDDPNKQIASWIMNWDTIIEYLKFVAKFLSELWMAVWVIFIMFAGYKYMVSVFNWLKAPTGTIKNAIFWVIIVIFSFAIFKTLTSLVWIS